MTTKDELQALIQGEAVEDSESLKKYSKDASIFEITPKIIVFPKNTEDIKAVVKFVSNHPNLSITPRSGGTDMSGGAINDSIILDVSHHLNKLVSIKENKSIVEPGMFYRDFEAETLKDNLLLPTFPASREICTVGGMVATNAGGELELTFGPVDRYITKLKVILADGIEYTFSSLTKKELSKKIIQKDYEGKIYSQILELIKKNKEVIQNAKPKVTKNATGYHLWDVWDKETFDLSKLIVGSQGTLGIITEIEFRLIKPKLHQVLLVISLPNLKELDQIVKKVLEYKPEAFEFYDDQTLKLAVDHAGDLAASFKHSHKIAALHSFLEEKLLKMRGKLPHLVLLANFTSDDKDDILQRAQIAKNALKNFNLKAEVKESTQSQEKYWIIRHKSFGLLMKYSKMGKASSFIDDIIVKVETLHEFLPKLNAIIEPYKHKMVYTLAGHIGDGNFHIIPLMDLSDPEVRAIIPELMDKVFDLVFSFNGSMSAEHNDGLIRGPYLPKMYGEEVYQLFKSVKNIFDPKNIFNPHKKTDATFKYSFDHMSKT